MTGDETRLREWARTVTAAPVENWSRLVGGNSRTTWATDSIVVRADTGDGPFSDTPLTLRRGATVYAALPGRGIPIPRFYGYDATVGAIALERATGTPAWDGDVLDALLGVLGRLHRIDADSL